MGKPKKPECKALLLDIEGTVTSISFVKDVLFPYARENVERYLTEHWNDGKLHCLRNSLINQSNKEAETDPDILVVKAGQELQTVIANVKAWIDKDKKITSLKELQGRMWELAYLTGEVQGHVYGEVPDLLRHFKSYHIPVYIYSSGSVHAQQLLFRHTVEGDLTPFLSGYFDTTTGPKVEADSYRKIAEDIEVAPGDIMFLTDVEREAAAAKAAGLQVNIVVREGNAPLKPGVEERFTTITCTECLCFEHEKA